MKSNFALFVLLLSHTKEEKIQICIITLFTAPGGQKLNVYAQRQKNTNNIRANSHMLKAESQKIKMGVIHLLPIKYD